MATLQEIIDRIVQLHAPRSWWIHESVLCRWASVPSIEGLSTREVLTEAIRCLERGYIIGSMNERIPVRQGRANLYHNDNPLSIAVQLYGKKEEFSTNRSLTFDRDTISAVPRWFFYGTSTAVQVKVQLQVAHEAMGIHWRGFGRARTQNEEAKIHWKGWYFKDGRRSISNHQATIIDICKQHSVDVNKIRDCITCSNYNHNRDTRQRLDPSFRSPSAMFVSPSSSSTSSSTNTSISPSFESPLPSL